MREAPDGALERAFIYQLGAERGPIFVTAAVGEFVGACACCGDRIVFVWHRSANAFTLRSFLPGIGKMLRKRKQIRRRRRVSFAQMAREIGPRLHMAFRRARIALWRFKRSPAQQDRAAMLASFAFIGIFAIGSVDAIITGRADFAPGSAYAAEYHPASVASAQAPIALASAEAAEAEVAIKSAEAIDYSFTTETLLGGPELELVAMPLFEDVMAEGAKTPLPEPVASIEADPTAL